MLDYFIFFSTVRVCVCLSGTRTYFLFSLAVLSCSRPFIFPLCGPAVLVATLYTYRHTYLHFLRLYLHFTLKKKCSWKQAVYRFFFFLCKPAIYECILQREMQLNCNPGFEASKKEKTIVSQREPVLWMWLLGTLEVASGLDLNKKKLAMLVSFQQNPPHFNWP